MEPFTRSPAVSLNGLIYFFQFCDVGKMVIINNKSQNLSIDEI
jgi:hypothetical protein